MSTWSRIAAGATAGFLGALLAGSSAMAREITVVSTAGPMPVVMGALIPIFERATGNKVTIKFEGVPQIYAQLKEGASIDLVLADAAPVVGDDERERRGVGIERRRDLGRVGRGPLMRTTA